MLKKVAECISFIVNPIFLSLVLVLIGIQEGQFSQTQRMFFTLFAATINGLLPSGFVYYLSKEGVKIDDVLGSKAVLKNRSFVLAWGIVILSFESLFLYFLGKPQPLFAILLCLLSLVFALFAINLYGKISIHIALITTFCLAMIALFGRSLWPILFLIPITAWSRLVLSKHTKKQLLAGFLVSLFITLVLFYYFKLL